MGHWDSCPKTLNFEMSLKEGRVFGMRQLVDTLSLFLLLWRDRLPVSFSPYHFSMCLGRQTSVVFCKAALWDRLDCSLFMLIRAKCYRHGGIGNVESFCGSVSMGFLDVSCLLLSLCPSVQAA